MSSADPVRDALSDVDPGPQDAEDPDLDELRDALDRDLDDSEDPEPDRSGFSIYRWARRIPEGSHLDFEAKEWWDPDTGGQTRLAFHLSDATEAGAGYPNLLGSIVALAEIYYGLAKEANGSASSGSDDSGDDPDLEDMDELQLGDSDE